MSRIDIKFKSLESWIVDFVFEKRVNFLSRHFYQLFQEYLRCKPLKSLVYLQELYMIDVRRWVSQWDVKFQIKQSHIICQIIRLSFLGLVE